MVSLLLSVTFACGLLIAVAHVVNKRFIAPVYDVAANLLAFMGATGASALLGNWLPASLSTGAIACWVTLAARTYKAWKGGEAASRLGKLRSPKSRPQTETRSRRFPT